MATALWREALQSAGGTWVRAVVDTVPSRGTELEPNFPVVQEPPNLPLGMKWVPGREGGDAVEGNAPSLTSRRCGRGRALSCLRVADGARMTCAWGWQQRCWLRREGGQAGGGSGGRGACLAFGGGFGGAVEDGTAQYPNPKTTKPHPHKPKRLCSSAPHLITRPVPPNPIARIPSTERLRLGGHAGEGDPEWY